MSKPENQRILFIVQEFTPGGAAYLCIKWIKRLIAHYDIDLMIIGPHEAKMLAELPEAVSIFSSNCNRLASRLLNSPGAASPLGALSFFRQRTELPPLNREYHAVLGTSILASWQACTAYVLARSGKKIIFLVDEALAAHPHESPRKKNVAELSIQVSDYVVSVSKSLFNSMSAKCTTLSGKPLEVIRPIVEMQSATHAQDIKVLPRDKPVILTVARLEPGKQIPESLYIHHALMQEGVDFRWYIVGKGSLESVIKNEIRRLGMQEHFILAGFQPNVEDWLKQCDVFALLSVSEGCPTVIMEALHCGCPVLSTEVHGVDELIMNEQTGIIVPNDQIAIKNQLSRLVLNRDLRDSLKQNLIHHPFELSPESDLKKLIKMIEAPKEQVSTTPAVSIMIPTYNQDIYIDRAISSALMQDFSALEVIVIDDASTDNTENICRKWLNDYRFKYFKNPQNLGRVKNYQHALRNLASGDWVLMLDGDDYLTDAGYIKTAWHSLQSHPGQNVVFVQAGHRVQYNDHSQPDINILPAIDTDEAIIQPGQYPKLVFNTGFFTHLGILFNRDAAIRNNCYSAPISSTDMDSFLRLSLQGPVILLNRIAGCWTQHGNNASANVPINEVAENVRIFREVAALAISKGVISASELNPPLTRYEAQTLAYLFSRTIGKTTHHPLDTLRLIPIIISINPYLLFNFTLLKAAAKTFIQLFIRMLKKLSPL